MHPTPHRLRAVSTSLKGSEENSLREARNTRGVHHPSHDSETLLTPGVISPAREELNRLKASPAPAPQGQTLPQHGPSLGQTPVCVEGERPEAGAGPPTARQLGQSDHQRETKEPLRTT